MGGQGLTAKISTRRADDPRGAYAIANAAETCGCTVVAVVYGPQFAFDDEGKPISSAKRFLRLFFSAKRDRYFCYHVFYRNNGVPNTLVDAEVEKQTTILHEDLDSHRAQHKTMN
jgi:hypothetical protein